jgi:hypothetical protein
MTYETRRILPPDFDWVKERHSCSPSIVIEKLRLQVQDDVEKRTALMTQAEKERMKFEIVSEGRRFTVQVEGKNQLYRGVTFSLTVAGIAVHDAAYGENLLYEAALTLSDDGECRLKVKDKEYDLWQFRKLVLQDIFFGHDVIYGKTGWA